VDARRGRGREARVGATVAAAALAAIVGAAAGAAGRAPLPLAPPFAAGALRAAPSQDWPTNGGNLGNERFSTVAALDERGVRTLRPAWRATLGSGGTPGVSGEATPVVYRGVMYIATGASDVLALDAATGRRLWAYRARLPADVTSCCGWASRGVALGDGKVFLARLDGRLVALAQRTGKPVWSARVGRWQDGYTLTAAPLYYDGLVLIGVSGSSFGIRGHMSAYDARTGRLVWRFATIPAPGQRGHETWPPGPAWRWGGAAVWTTPSVDPDLGLVYFATGNPAPHNGRYRAGDNLFSSSLLALDARTGRYRWHYQFVHHDIWDYDCATPSVLLDVRVRGRVRRAVAQACKTGWVYLLDRRTGRPLLGIAERRVEQSAYQRTARTQPFPAGDPFVPQCADPRDFAGREEEGKSIRVACIFAAYGPDRFVSVKPSALGGANWPPLSYSRRTGYLYVCGVDRPTALRALPVPRVMPADAFYTGVTGLLGEPDQIRGTFTAIDTRTNTVAWQNRWREQMCYSGSVATAGGVVLVGRGAQGLVAYSATSGRELWRRRLDAGVNAPPVVYRARGRVFVAVLAGGSAQGGEDTPPGDTVWAFSPAP
jgi:PQQ-dependent dehydrogenase (methanol/ethanol family)